MAVAEEKWQIDKLSKNNWATWKFQIKYCLMAKNLWEIVDGTETLADGASQQQRQEFRKRRNKAAAVIVTSVKPERWQMVPVNSSGRNLENAEIKLLL